MWDKRYNKEVFIYGKEPNDFLKERYQTIPQGGRVLCLGEGEGRNAVFLAQHGYQVTAVDLSKVGLEKADKLAADKGVKINTHVADLSDFDLGVNQWDSIVSIWLHVAKNTRENLHQKIEMALKKNGVFLLEAYTLNQLKMTGKGGPPASKMDSFVSLEQLKEELPHLNPLVGIEKERRINEGEMHQGMSAVVQFVAKKS